MIETNNIDYNVDAIFQRIKERVQTIPDDKEIISDEEATKSKAQFEDLVSACAKELSALYKEVGLANGRMVKRLAEVLLHESSLFKSPSIAVLHVRRKSMDEFITIEDEFKYGENYFVPCWEKITHIDGDISFIVTKDHIMKCSNDMKWEQVPGQPTLNISEGVLWIGIEAPEKLDDIDGLAVFFECDESTKNSILFSSLPFTQWFFQGHLIRAMCVPQVTKHQNRLFSDLTYPNQLVDDLSTHVFDHRFVTLDDNLNLPNKFDNIISSSPLPIEVTGKVLKWFEVHFPSNITKEVIQSARCYLNCFPAANMFRTSERFDLRRGGKVFQLKDYKGNFIGIDRVMCNPDDNPLEILSKDYNIRKGGINKFDELSAKEKLMDLVSSMEKESQAYRGLEDIDTRIGQILTDLEDVQREIYKNPDISDEMPIFICFPNTELKCIIEVSYFSMNANSRAQIKKGTKLTGSGNAIAITDLYRPRTDWEGKEVEQFKHILLSRGKIVTTADVHSACLAFFNTEIIQTEISVSQKAKIGADPKQGVIEYLQVTLKSDKQSVRTQEEWDLAAKHLELYLTKHSSGFLPFNVQISVT